MVYIKIVNIIIVNIYFIFIFIKKNIKILNLFIIKSGF